MASLRVGWRFQLGKQQKLLRFSIVPLHQSQICVQRCDDNATKGANSVIETATLQLPTKCRVLDEITVRHAQAIRRRVSPSPPPSECRPLSPMPASATGGSSAPGRNDTLAFRPPWPARSCRLFQLRALRCPSGLVPALSSNGYKNLLSLGSSFAI